jgi:hypothetical protein
LISQESYTIPDSQPLSEKGNDEADLVVDGVCLARGGDVREGSDDERSDGTVTPKRALVLSPPGILSGNLISDSRPLRGHQSNQDMTPGAHVSESFPQEDFPATKSRLRRRSDLDGECSLVIESFGCSDCICSLTGTEKTADGAFFSEPIFGTTTKQGLSSSSVSLRACDRGVVPVAPFAGSE